MAKSANSSKSFSVKSIVHGCEFCKNNHHQLGIFDSDEKKIGVVPLHSNQKIQVMCQQMIDALATKQSNKKLSLSDQFLLQLAANVQFKIQSKGNDDRTQSKMSDNSTQ